MNINKINKQLLISDFKESLLKCYNDKFKIILNISFDSFLNKLNTDLEDIKKFLNDDDIYQLQSVIFDNYIILGGLHLTQLQCKRLNELKDIKIPNLFFIAFDKKTNRCEILQVMSVYIGRNNIKGQTILV